MDVDCVEGWEARYGKGGMNSRIQTPRFIQRQHQGANILHRPPDGPG